jgi:U3 small nucleolar RNA-associated protein 21
LLLQVSIRFEAPFAPTCLCHPDTYLNKVVVGGADGSLQLWNFGSGQLVHTFAGW